MLRKPIVAQAGLVLGAAVAYVLLFFLLYPTQGAEVVALAVLPVAVAGWLWGWRAGLIAGLLSLPLTTLLLNLVGHQPGGWDVALRGGGVGFIALLFIGLAIGRISEFAKKVRQELAERKQAEMKFRQAVEAAPNGMIMVDAEGRIILANAQAERMFGYLDDEFSGMPIEQLVPERFRTLHSRHQDAFRQQPRARPMVGRELSARRKDGAEFPAEIGLNPLSTSDGEFTLVTIVDLTERKQAETTRQALLEIMQGVVATTDLREFLRRVHQSIARVIYAENFFIALYHKDTGLFEEVYSVDRYDPPAPPYELGKSISAYVFRTGRPLLLAQEHFDELAARGEVELVGTNSPSWLGVPLKTPTETVGVMVVQHYEDPNIYSARDVEFLASIAGQVALAVERKWAEAEVRRRADEFAALYETAIAIGAQQDLPSLLQTIIERATMLFAAPSGAIFLYDAARRDLELAVIKGVQLPIGTRLALGEGMAGRVAQTRQPLIVNNYQSWEYRSPKYEAIPMTASMQVPMLYGGELIGVLDISELHTTMRKFTEADVHLLTLFAGQAASAVHNTRLLESILRRLTEREAVSRVSAALRAAHSLDEMLPLLLDETLAVLGTDAGSIVLYDPPSGGVRPLAGRGWFTAIDQRPLKPGEGIAGHVFSSGEVYLSREFATDPRARKTSHTQIPPGWGGVCLPIRTTHEIVGAMFIAVQSPRELTDDEVRLLTTLAEIAGNAIHRTQLHEQTERNLQHLAALRAIDLLITSSLDLRVTLNVLIDHTLTQLGVHAADALLFNPATQTLDYAAGHGFRANAIARSSLRLGEGHVGRAVLERRIVNIPDLPATGAAFERAALLAGEDFVAYYGVPLLVKGQVKGVLEIFHRAPLTPDPEWLNFLEALAGQAALAIDNAELFEGLQRSNMDLALAYDATIEGWARALELRDRETEGHTRRVTELTMRLARAFGLSEAELVHVRRGAMLHDIGKMGIPDSILLNPEPLTEAEWAIMRQHPVLAYEMLSPIAYLRQALDIPYCHHEKWDGSGYPRGLRGEQIPLAARIFAVADVWDALRSDRPYRAAWSSTEVYEHIRSLAGVHLDPQVVEVFFRIVG